MEVMYKIANQRKFAVGMMVTNDRVRLTQSPLIEIQKSNTERSNQSNVRPQIDARNIHIYFSHKSRLLHVKTDL